MGEVPDLLSDERRYANYEPNIWDSGYVETAKSGFLGERHLERASELKEQVRMLLSDESKVASQKMELVDSLQKLGISYLFEGEIKRILSSLYEQKHGGRFEKTERDLFSTSLEFRLLRQHGFNIQQEVFDCLKNENGDFDDALASDTKGLLELYEASFLCTKREDTLILARAFATRLLKSRMEDRHNEADDTLFLLIQNALAMATHWRPQKANARRFIEVYKKILDANPVVLELAKLDFNILQAQYQQEVKQAYRWWKEAGFEEKCPIMRVRIVENYVLANETLLHVECGYKRVMVTKAIALITVLDDIFDVYGTIEELRRFTAAAQRWDVEEVHKLSNFFKAWFQIVNNAIDETVELVMRERGFQATPFLRKSWIDLILAYMQEAEWYAKGYTPTLEEYMNTAWVSIATPLVLQCTYFLIANHISEEATQSLFQDHGILRSAGIIFRIADDVSTSEDEMERGDTFKSVQCYMHENRVSVGDAKDYLRGLIEETWMKMNEEHFADSPFPLNFINISIESARTALQLYDGGDGYGMHTPSFTKDIHGLLFEPVT